MLAPDWFRHDYKDAQGRSRRIAVAQSEQALREYAAKHGKQIEATYQHGHIAKRRLGQVVKVKLVSKWYGLLSA